MSEFRRKPGVYPGQIGTCESLKSQPHVDQSRLETQLSALTPKQAFVKNLNGNRASWIGLYWAVEWSSQWKWVDGTVLSYR